MACSFKYGLVLLVASSISLALKAQNCTVNAGIPQTVCATGSLTLTGAAAGSLPASPTYTWTKITGPGSIISTPDQLNTTVVNLTPGNYIFALSATCQDNATATNTVAITVLPAITAPDAGPDITQCATGTLALSANAPGPGETGTWTIASGSGTNTFSTSNSPTSNFSTNQGGVKKLVWTISNGTCSRSDTLHVNIIGAAAVSAGPDQTLNCSGNSATLAGSNPGLSPQTGLWTQVSGPSTAIFSNPNSNASKATNLVVGTYVFRWTVSGPCLNGSDEVSITVNNTFAKPNAGSNASYTQFCNDQNIGSLVLSAPGMSPGESCQWTQTSGPAGAVIASPNNSSTTVSGLDGVSTYVFSYVVSNANCTSNTVTHTVYFHPPVQNLSNPPAQNLVCGASTATIPVTYTYSLPSAAGLVRAGLKVSGPAGVTPTITAPTTITGSDNWNISGLSQPGTYVIRLEYRNACGTQYRDVTINVSKTPTAANAGSDQLFPCNATTGSLVGNTPTTGGGTWSQVSGPTTAVFSNATAPTTNISNLSTGVYTFRWFINAGSACGPSMDDVNVTISSTNVVGSLAGTDDTICNAFPAKLSGNTPGLTQTGTWTVIPSAGVTFSNTHDPNATASGLAPNTTYQFIWKIVNACSSSADTVLITTDSVSSQLPISAGADQCLASGITAVNLSGSSNGAASILWSAPDGGSIANATVRNTTATVPGDGNYRFVYTLAIPGCGSGSDTMAVTIAAPVTTASAGPDQNICTTSVPLIVNVTGNTPSSGTPSWSLYAGNAGTGIASPGTPATAISNLNEGLYVYRYTISNGVCPASTDDINIVVGRPPSDANAGTDITQCNINAGTAVALAATAPTTGTGYWSIVSGPQGTTPTFSSTTNPTATFNGWSTGSYLLQWTTINSPVCPSSRDTVAVTLSAKANGNPGAAGNNLCNANALQLTGTYNTNGTWTATSLPSGAPSPVITPTSGNTAVAGNLVPGNYTFTYTIPAAGSCPVSTATRAIVNYRLPTQADAGGDQNLCPGTTTVTLTGNTPTTGTGTWSLSSGPSTPAAGTPNSNKADSTFNNLQSGVYVFRYSISTGSGTGTCPASTDSAVVVIEKPATAGPDQRLCNAGSTLLSANAPAYYTAQWSQVSGPNTALIANSTSAATNISNLSAGDYLFRWEINTPGGCGLNEDTVQVTIDTPPAPADAGTNQSLCENSGSITLGTPAQPGVLYSWSPASYLDDTTAAQPVATPPVEGSYTYRLTISKGSCVSTDEVTVVSKPLPRIPVTSAPDSLCSNSTRLVSITSADPAAVYTWSNALGTGTAKTVVPGSYTITPSLDGCTNSSASFSIAPKEVPAASFTITPASCKANFTAANTGASYAWDFGQDAIPATASATTPAYSNVVYTTTGNKTARLIVTAANGCTDTAYQSFIQGCVLSTDLLSFQLTAREPDVQLDWAVTKTETLKGFDVERSTDGRSYNSIGYVNAYPVAKVTDHYRFIDATVPATANKIYYRLKIEEQNGTVLYSPVRMRALNPEAGMLVKVVPNPFSNRALITLPNELTGTATVRILDMKGMQVYTTQMTAGQVLELTDRELPVPGNYLLQVNGRDLQQTVKITRQ